MNSISEAIINVKALLHDRIKSPFISTFIFVALYHYWPILFYSFDSNKTTEDKIKIINNFFKSDLSPNIFEMVLYAVITTFCISLLSIAAYFFKEVAEGVNKRIRNRFNPDYINSKKYTEALSSLTDNINSLTESNSHKDEKIVLLSQLANLNDLEKNILKEANKNGGVINESEMNEEKLEICKKLHKNHLLGQSTGQYRITNKYLLAFIDSQMRYR